MAGAMTASRRTSIRSWAICMCPTCQRTSATGRAEPRSSGNSVFLFEMAGVCIAHLSHLHHLLTDQDLTLLGHVDVVMAPVDGVYTMSQPDMAKVLDELHPRLVSRCTTSRAMWWSGSWTWYGIAIRSSSMRHRRCRYRGQRCRSGRPSRCCQEDTSVRDHTSMGGTRPMSLRRVQRRSNLDGITHLRPRAPHHGRTSSHVL